MGYGKRKYGGYKKKYSGYKRSYKKKYSGYKKKSYKKAPKKRARQKSTPQQVQLRHAKEMARELALGI